MAAHAYKTNARADLLICSVANEMYSVAAAAEKHENEAAHTHTHTHTHTHFLLSRAASRTQDMRYDLNIKPQPTKALATYDTWHMYDCRIWNKYGCLTARDPKSGNQPTGALTNAQGH